MVNITDIIASDDKITFFVGSGISFNSGVASINDIVGNIINTLTVDEIESATRNKNNWYKDIGEFKDDKFELKEQFERFMGFFKESIPFDTQDRTFPDLLKKIFASSENSYHPNANHYAIAQLAKNGRCKHIYTTNFDTLIEQALEGFGLKQGKDFEVIYEDFENNIQKAENSNKVFVIKIHGCVSQPETIITTINDIIKETNIIPRSQAVKNIFLGDRNNKLVIAGYSFSDEYDVNVFVKQLYNEPCKSIIYLEHRLNGSECIETKFPTEQKYSFLSEFSDAHYCYLDTTQALCQISQYQGKKDSNKVCLKYDFLETILFNDLSQEEKSIKALQISIEIQRLLGHYVYVIPLAKRLVKITENTLGKNYLDYATSLDTLAGLYHYQELHDDAEPLYKQALNIRENALGKNHPDYATSLNNLAELHHAKGQYKDAEPLYKKALDIRENALKKSHADHTTSLNDLAELYHCQELYNKAEPLYKKALDIREKTLGKEHPDYVTSLNDLAEIYHDQGQYKDAEPHYKDALEIRQKTLGKEHPDYATSLNDLAELYHAQGQYKDAEPLYKKALDIREKALGDKHPDYATSLNDLAELYHAQGQYKYKDAEPLYKKALKIRKKTLKEEHPDYATSLNDLAELYHCQELYDDAEPLYKKALDIRRKALGEEHTDYVTSLSGLAELYYDRGQYKYEDAKSFCEEALNTIKTFSKGKNSKIQPIKKNLQELQKRMKKK